MKTGISIFRERAGISKAELARRVGTNRQQLGRLEDGQRKLTREWAELIAPHLNCTAQELLFPDQTRVDVERFSNVFDLVEEGQKPSSAPSIAIGSEFLSRMLPKRDARKLRLLVIDEDTNSSIVQKGDALVIDIEDNRPTRAGIYALEIAGVIQWRYLQPTTSGLIQVSGPIMDDSSEVANPSDLKIIGRARMKISSI